MKELFIFIVEAFIFTFLALRLADLLWDWLIKAPQNDEIKKFKIGRGILIWILFASLKHIVFYFDEGGSEYRSIPVQYPYFIKEGVDGSYLYKQNDDEAIPCEISQFAISGSKFYYTCKEHRTDIRIFDCNDQSIRIAQTGPVLKDFSPQYYWYHLVKIDLSGIIIFAVLQLWIMFKLNKSRSKH
ncbi:MAG: hypothetical protein H6Q26_904 [Bacteroidetes bacterium]|uniref:hypothetical protein n=1 Tax=unclassified Chitinophaga TaxID=2619133 RepID=UPI0009C4B9C0|nr:MULTISPECIES: hypothetical protein [unclassified Chitinophaga]MBP1650747.1 hypothetical protein [Bacteroidota bacterium]OMP76713.1 hypothetical protein BW716_23235 [[Flexibacter] sp. ATCC 35208]WPV70450.1 hypothetical protein QQL36_17215 [Chitinophaga sp. LS1]